MSKNTIFLDFIQSSLVNFDNSETLVLQILKQCKFIKVKQHWHTLYCRNAIIQILLFLKLASFKSVFEFVKADIFKWLPFGKDVIYQVKNNPAINWRGNLLKQVFQTYKKLSLQPVRKYSDKPEDLPCYIIDDTDQFKTGRRIEFIGKIFSHVNFQGYRLGYKSLNLALWTGKILLHLDFTKHIELGKKKNQGMSTKHLEQRFTKQRPTGSYGILRTKELLKKKTDTTVEMVKRAIRKGFKACYILSDSWFFCEKILKLAVETKVDLISRAKFNNWKYRYKNKDYTLPEFTRKFRYLKQRAYDKKLNIYHVTLQASFKNIAIQIFLYKEKKNGSKWNALITSDLKLEATRAYKIYKNRWSIEVSFKELKQNLTYGKCQSNDFDAQIADSTLSLMAYNYLSLEKTVHQNESIGGLFAKVSQSWIKPNLMQEFWKQTYQLIEQLAQTLQIEFDKLLDICLNTNSFFKNIQKLTLTFTTET